MEFGGFNFTVHGNTWANNGSYGPDWDGASKAEVASGQLIFMLFVFLFVIVFMNILNAIAIGDIQVIFCFSWYDLINSMNYPGLVLSESASFSTSNVSGCFQ